MIFPPAAAAMQGSTRVSWEPAGWLIARDAGDSDQSTPQVPSFKLGIGPTLYNLHWDAKAVRRSFGRWSYDFRVFAWVTPHAYPQGVRVHADPS
jgi:hypothetical protein